MSTSSPTSGAGQAVRAFVRAVLRLLVVLVLGLLVGAAAYFGSVFIYQRAILPAEENTARLNALETEQAGRFVQLNEQLVTQEAQLQTQHAFAYNMIITATLQLATQAARLSALERQVTYQGELIGELNEDTGWLKTQVATLGTPLAAWEGRLATLEVQVERAGAANDIASLRVALHVLRARQHLMAGNYGLAQDELSQARVWLLQLWERVPEGQQATVRAWMDRLDLAMTNLPTLPVLAAEDLDILWRSLIAGFPATSATPTPLRTLPLASTATQPVGTMTLASPIGTLTPQPTLTLRQSPSPSPTPSPRSP
ncbi:MAG: hypothetical protein N3A60_02235 [Thermanaerothrix sp.]|nr:hypothetical protein [Thermanaerothrix sp.]